MTDSKTISTTKNTRAKDVLPNKPHAGRRNDPRKRRNGPACCSVTLFAASAFHSVAAGSDGNAQRVFVPRNLEL